MPFNEYFAEESGTSSSTARNDNITNSLSAIQNSLLPERFLHPEKVKLLPSWAHHKVQREPSNPKSVARKGR